MATKPTFRKPTFTKSSWTAPYSCKLGGAEYRNVNYSLRETAKLVGLTFPQFMAFMVRTGIAHYENISNGMTQRITLNGRFTEKGFGEMYFTKNKSSGSAFSQGVFSEKGMDLFFSKPYQKCFKAISGGMKLNDALVVHKVNSFMNV